MKNVLIRILTAREKLVLILGGIGLVGFAADMVIGNPEYGLFGLYASPLLITGLYMVISDLIEMMQLRKFLYVRGETFLIAIFNFILNNIHEIFIKSEPPGFTVMDYIGMATIVLLLLVVYIPAYSFRGIRENTENMKQQIIAGSKSKREAREAWTVIANNILELRKKNRDILT